MHFVFLLLILHSGFYNKLYYHKSPTLPQTPDNHNHQFSYSFFFSPSSFRVLCTYYFSFSNFYAHDSESSMILLQEATVCFFDTTATQPKQTIPSSVQKACSYELLTNFVSPCSVSPFPHILLPKQLH